LKIVLEADRDLAAFNLINSALSEYNIKTTGFGDYKSVNVLLRDEAGEVKGGALGGIWGEWLYVKLLWVAEELRGQGYGSQLLTMAEAEAVASACRGIFLETFDFQAYSFYLRFGFEEVGHLADFPPGHTQYYMIKKLR
jgi:ribosomal protein S18 acetylase RimI-like enzyme